LNVHFSATQRQIFFHDSNDRKIKLESANVVKRFDLETFLKKFFLIVEEKFLSQNEVRA
jgi:hypothetical protein